MKPDRAQSAVETIGVGIYTPAEAGRLTGVSPSKIRRWLRGHAVDGRFYEPLWTPQIDLGDDGFCLGFRDLQEVRITAAFIAKGLSPQRVRQTIEAARELVQDERPMSTSRFRTDGRTAFLQIVEEDGQIKLIDLFRKQYAFREIVEQSLSNLEFAEDGTPTLWWPRGRTMSVVVDPTRAFGQPIEAETSVPIVALVKAADAEGSPEAAARAWDVPVRAVRRALAFEKLLPLPKAA